MLHRCRRQDVTSGDQWGRVAAGDNTMTRQEIKKLRLKVRLWCRILCPTCGSHPGHSCYEETEDGLSSIDEVHAARKRAAKKRRYGRLDLDS